MPEFPQQSDSPQSPSAGIIIGSMDDLPEHATLGSDPSAELSRLAHGYGLKPSSNTRTPARNKAVGGAPNSYHLEGAGYDFAGPPASMKAFAEHLRDTYGPSLRELYHDPIGGWKDGQSVGSIGGHSDHVHVAVYPQIEGNLNDLPEDETAITDSQRNASLLSDLKAANPQGVGTSENLPEEPIKLKAVPAEPPLSEPILVPGPLIQQQPTPIGRPLTEAEGAGPNAFKSNIYHADVGDLVESTPQGVKLKTGVKPERFLQELYKNAASSVGFTPDAAERYLKQYGEQPIGRFFQGVDPRNPQLGVERILSQIAPAPPGVRPSFRFVLTPHDQAAIKSMLAPEQAEHQTNLERDIAAARTSWLDQVAREGLKNDLYDLLPASLGKNLSQASEEFTKGATLGYADPTLAGQAEGERYTTPGAEVGQTVGGIVPLAVGGALGGPAGLALTAAAQPMLERHPGEAYDPEARLRGALINELSLIPMEITGGIAGLAGESGIKAAIAKALGSGVGFAAAQPLLQGRMPESGDWKQFAAGALISAAHSIAAAKGRQEIKPEDLNEARARLALPPAPREVELAMRAGPFEAPAEGPAQTKYPDSRYKRPTLDVTGKGSENVKIPEALKVQPGAQPEAATPIETKPARVVYHRDTSLPLLVVGEEGNGWVVKNPRTGNTYPIAKTLTQEPISRMYLRGTGEPLDVSRILPDGTVEAYHEKGGLEQFNPQWLETEKPEWRREISVPYSTKENAEAAAKRYEVANPNATTEVRPATKGQGYQWFWKEGGPEEKPQAQITVPENLPEEPETTLDIETWRKQRQSLEREWMARHKIEGPMEGINVHEEASRNYKTLKTTDTVTEDVIHRLRKEGYEPIVRWQDDTSNPTAKKGGGEILFFSPYGDEESAFGKHRIIRVIDKDAKLYSGKSSEDFLREHGLWDKADPIIGQIAGTKPISMAELDELTDSGAWMGDLPTPEYAKNLPASELQDLGPRIYFSARQNLAASELKKIGYQGARWEHEDDLLPKQWQIWDVDILKRPQEIQSAYEQKQEPTQGMVQEPADRAMEDVNQEPWQMTRREWRTRNPLPEQPRLPETGTVPYVQTDDSAIYPGTAQDHSHVLLADRLGIPPERVTGGGFITNGVIQEGGTASANIGGWAEQNKAKSNAEHARAVRKAFNAGKLIPNDVLADYPELQKRNLPEENPAIQQGASPQETGELLRKKYGQESTNTVYDRRTGNPLKVIGQEGEAYKVQNEQTGKTYSIHRNAVAGINHDDLPEIHREMKDVGLDAQGQLEAFRAMGIRDFDSPAQMVGGIRMLDAAKDEGGQPYAEMMYGAKRGANHKIVGRFPGGEKLMVVDPDGEVHVHYKSPYSRTGNALIKQAPSRFDLGQVPEVSWEDIGLLSDPFPSLEDFQRVNPNADKNGGGLTDAELQKHFPQVYKNIHDAEAYIGEKAAREAVNQGMESNLPEESTDPEFVQRARERNRQRLSGNTLSANPVGAFYDTAVTVGWDVIKAAKIPEFAQWSKEMIERLGENVRPHLEGIWDALTKPAPTFFSPLERNIKLKMPNSMPAVDLRNMLNKVGISRDELEWTNFNDHLKDKANSGEKIYRKDALEFLSRPENQIQIKEVWHGGGSTVQWEDQDQHLVAARDKTRDDLGEHLLALGGQHFDVNDQSAIWRRARDLQDEDLEPDERQALNLNMASFEHARNELAEAHASPGRLIRKATSSDGRTLYVVPNRNAGINPPSGRPTDTIIQRFGAGYAIMDQPPLVELPENFKLQKVYGGKWQLFDPEGLVSIDLSQFPNMDHEQALKRSLASLNQKHVIGSGDNIEQATGIVERQLGASKEVRYGNYVTPGGRNQRELLLTLPTKTGPDVMEIDKIHGEYRSPHWDEPNVLSHIRMNDREVPIESIKDQYPDLYSRLKSEGKDIAKVLHLEEIQSDWMQSGRRIGFRLDPQTIDLVANREEGYYEIRTSDGEFITNVLEDWGERGSTQGTYTPEEAIAEARKRLQGLQPEWLLPWNIAHRAPSAPFQKNWQDLSFKQMLKYSSEHDYDLLSWTTGAEQFNRWGSPRVDWQRGGFRIALKGGEINDETVQNLQRRLDDAKSKVESSPVQPGDRVATVGAGPSRGGYSYSTGKVYEAYLNTDGNLAWKKADEFGGTRAGRSNKYTQELRAEAERQGLRWDRSAGHGALVQGVDQRAFQDQKTLSRELFAARSARMLRRWHPSEEAATQAILSNGSNPADFTINPYRGWRVNASEQSGGLAGDVDIEQEAIRQNILKSGTTEISTQAALRKIIEKTMDRDRSEYSEENWKKHIDQMTDSVWNRMQTEEVGSHLPRLAGFEGFYDKIITDFARSYGKKFGAKVGEVGIPGTQGGAGDTGGLHITERPDGSYWVYPTTRAIQEGRFPQGGWQFPTKQEAQSFFIEKTNLPMHAIDIPQRMRDSVIKAGQPLFGAQEGEPPAVTDSLMRLQGQMAQKKRNPPKAEIQKINPQARSLIDLKPEELQKNFPEASEQINQAKVMLGDKAANEAVRHASTEDLPEEVESTPERVRNSQQWLRERMNGGRLGAGQDVVPAMYHTAMVVGWEAVKVGKYAYGKAEDFTAWSKDVVGRLGDRVRPYLDEIWNKLNEQAPQWYSPLENSIKLRMPNKASADQVKGILRSGGFIVKGEGGIERPNDEAYWTGTYDFLQRKSSAKEPVTKQEILDHLAKNRVELQETQFDDNEHYNDKVVDLMRRMNDEYAQAGNYGGLDYELADLEAQGNIGTKFTAHTTPGGTNHRELTLSLPTSLMKETGLSGSVMPNQISQKLFGKNYEHLDEGERERVDDLFQHGDKAYNVPRGHAYGIPEADQNRIALIRVNDRVGPNGEKILHLDEYQDDLQNEIQGLKKQIADTEKADPRYELIKGVDGWLVRNNQLHTVRLYGSEIEARDAFRRGDMNQAMETEQIRSSLGRLESLLPFRGKSHELALKRVLDYGIRNGYDVISWATGSQVAERYDLSKQVDSISATRNTDGTFQLKVVKDGLPLNEFARESIPPEKLADWTGKDLAEKIQAATEKQSNRWHVFSGVELKVGGEGKKTLYDNLIPNFLSKYTKRWGGKVGEVRISDSDNVGVDILQTKRGWALNDRNTGEIIAEGLTENEAESRAGEINQKTGQGPAVHSLKITPEMRDAILKTGQPLFGSSEGEPPMVIDARARLAESMSGRKMNMNPFQDMADLALIAGYKTFQNAKKFGGWSNQMIKQLGEQVRPHLKSTYAKIKLLADINQPGQEGAVSLGGINSSGRIPVEKARPLIKDAWADLDPFGEEPEPSIKAVSPSERGNAKLTEPMLKGARRLYHKAGGDYSYWSDLMSDEFGETSEGFHGALWNYAQPTTWSHAVDQWRKAQMLMSLSPWTHKVGSLIGATGLNEVVQPVASGLDAVWSKATGKPRDLLWDPAGIAQAASKTASIQTAKDVGDIMRRGYTEKSLEQGALPFEMNTKWPVANAMVNYVFRTFKAGVHPFVTYALERNMHEMAKLIAVGEKKAGLSSGDETRIQQIMNGEGITEGSYATMQGYAELAAADATFQKNNLIYKELQALKHRNEFWYQTTNGIIPFGRAPSNAILKSLELAPGGGATYRTAEAVARAFKYDSAFPDQASRRTFEKAWAQLPIGLALYTLGAVLHRHGYMTSLGYKTGFKDEEGNRREKVPGALLIGDKQFDIARYSPIGLVMAMGATYDELRGQSEETGHSWPEDFARSIINKDILEKIPLLSQVGMIGKWMDTGRLPSMFSNLPMTLIPGYATGRDVLRGANDNSGPVTGYAKQVLHIKEAPPGGAELRLLDKVRKQYGEPLPERKKEQIKVEDDIAKAIQSKNYKEADRLYTEGIKNRILLHGHTDEDGEDQPDTATINRIKDKANLTPLQYLIKHNKSIDLEAALDAYLDKQATEKERLEIAPIVMQKEESYQTAKDAGRIPGLIMKTIEEKIKRANEMGIWKTAMPKASGQ